MKSLLLSFVFLTFSILCLANVNPATTTIVVIDGKALLVDLNEKGEIITTYMEVPEYFTTKKDHATKVTEAKAHYVKLTKREMDQIRFISMVDEGWTLDEFMVNNLKDISTHYHQTYANEIVITAAKNKKNTRVLEDNIQRIKSLLVSYGVLNDDIHISYKIDRSEEPTRFIKVASHLKQLSIQ